MPGAKGFVRKNGFQRPYEDLQVATWVLYPLIVGAFYALILPVLGDGWTSPLRLTMGVLYLSLHLWAARAAYVVTAADPADPLLSASEKYRAGGHNTRGLLPPLHETCYFPAAKDEYAECRPVSSSLRAAAGCALDTCYPCSSSPDESEEAKDKCFYCEAEVSCQSKHCRYCDKCVHRFDHHCKWLNNCVGSANYRDFVAVLASTLCFTTLQLATSIALVADYFNHPDGPLADRAAALVGGTTGGSKLWAGLLLGIAALVLPVVVLIAQLLHFHTVLLFRRQTTYEFVSEVSMTPRPKPKPRPAPGSFAAAPQRSAPKEAVTIAAIAAARAAKEARDASEAAAEVAPLGEASIEAVASGESQGEIELRNLKAAL